MELFENGTESLDVRELDGLNTDVLDGEQLNIEELQHAIEDIPDMSDELGGKTEGMLDVAALYEQDASADETNVDQDAQDEQDAQDAMSAHQEGAQGGVAEEQTEQRA